MADGISLREFGRQVGVSGEYVRRAVKDGKIPADCVGEIILTSGKPRPVITDPARAAEHWGRNRDVTQVRDKSAMAAGARRGWAQRRGEEPGPSNTLKLNGANHAGGGDGDDDGDVDGLPSITKSKRRTEFYKSEDARLDHEERRGLLVNAEQVKAGFVNMVTLAKTRLMGVPSKAKARIPTLTVHDIEILEDLIADALTEIATDG